MSLTFDTLTGAQIDAALDRLAQLRIVVFRDWPYLYDGDLDYERRYLASYRDNPRAVLVAARQGGQIVGAATGVPMEDHAEDFAWALQQAGVDVTKTFYCAESVLLSTARGQGAGHAFFDLREAQARRLGRRWSAFCAVVRPDDHPARPAGYRPLDPFWRKRGYAPVAGAFAHFAWRDTGEPAETVKPLQLWLKDLSA